MKTVIFTRVCLFILVFILTGLSACSHEDGINERSERETSYDRMGRLHNEGLDYVLEKITEGSPLTKGGGRILPGMDAIQQMCVDFARMKGCRMVTRSVERSMDSVDPMTFLSERQQKFLILAKEIVDRSRPDRVLDFTAEMKDFEEGLKAEEELSDPEKEVLLNVTAVCRYSAAYWAENYEKWQVELYGMNGITTKSLKTRSEGGAYVSKEWWEKYKTIVWADGTGGIAANGGYYIEDSTVESVAVYMEK